MSQKVGNICANFATVDGVEGEILTNESDTMFCGQAIYGLDGRVSAVEWQGECVAGRCAVCRETSFFSTAKGLVHDPTDAMFPNAICGDRVCVNGIYQSSTAVLFSWKRFWTNPVIWLNVIGMVCVMMGAVSFIVYGLLILFRDNKKSKSGDKGGDYKPASTEAES